MTITELLEGHWFEYSGGSRPGTNKIRFIAKDGREVYVEIRYVFDWNTGETEHLSFRLKRSEFNALAEQLYRRGEARLESRSESQELDFHWKQTPNGFTFCLKGHTTTSFGNPAGIEMADFREVRCGPLSP